MAKEITIGFEKFVHIFNAEGKEVSEEFLAATTVLNILMLSDY